LDTHPGPLRVWVCVIGHLYSNTPVGIGVIRQIRHSLNTVLSSMEHVISQHKIQLTGFIRHSFIILKVEAGAIRHLFRI
jgi:hypothetical protein